MSPYYTLDEHTWVPDVLLISTHVWARLSSEERRWLEDAVASSVIEQRRLWREASAHALAQIRAAGVEVIEPDKVAFRRAVQPLFESYRGTLMNDLLSEIARIP